MKRQALREATVFYIFSLSPLETTQGSRDFILKELVHTLKPTTNASYLKMRKGKAVVDLFDFNEKYQTIFYFLSIYKMAKYRIWLLILAKLTLLF
jgi:hypothetical protein